MKLHDHETRLRQSAQRAISKSSRVTELCERVMTEMDEITANHGIPTAELSDEDSVVIAIETAQSAVAGTRKS